MDKYKVTITQFKENPNFDPKKGKKTFSNVMNHEYGDDSDQKYIQARVLEIELNEQEFQALKKSVLAVM